MQPTSTNAKQHNTGNGRQVRAELLVKPPPLLGLASLPLAACELPPLAVSVSHTLVVVPKTVAVAHDPITRAPTVGVAGIVTSASDGVGNSLEADEKVARASA